jgi:hypothetical protein
MMMLVDKHDKGSIVFLLLIVGVLKMVHLMNQ